jgi:hypothetical protein
MNTAVIIQSDFQVELVSFVFHRKRDLVCTQLSKPDSGKIFFNTIERQPAAVRNEPLGFSFCSQLLSFVHNVVLPTHWITFIGNKGFREGMDMRIRVVKESFFNLAVL